MDPVVVQPHAQHVMQVTATCVTALEYATRRHLIPSSANAESSHRHPCGYRHSAKLDMLGVADPHVLCGAPTDKTANEHATTTIIRTMGFSFSPAKHPVAINASPLYKPSSPRRASTVRSKFWGAVRHCGKAKRTDEARNVTATTGRACTEENA